jgi:type IV secretory pathway VirB3-like protein
MPGSFRPLNQSGYFNAPLGTYNQTILPALRILILANLFKPATSRDLLQVVELRLITAVVQLPMLLEVADYLGALCKALVTWPIWASKRLVINKELQQVKIILISWQTCGMSTLVLIYLNVI